jgi:hypothetical protein
LNAIKLRVINKKRGQKSQPLVLEDKPEQVKRREHAKNMEHDVGEMKPARIKPPEPVVKPETKAPDRAARPEQLPKTGNRSEKGVFYYERDVVITERRINRKRVCPETGKNQDQKLRNGNPRFATEKHPPLSYF